MCKKDNNEQKEEILTLKQVSRKLKIGTHKLREWAKSGVLRPIRLVAMPPCKYTHYKYTREAVDTFLDKNTTRHDQEEKRDEPL